MRIIVAPDSYKGSLSAVKVAKAITAGVVTALPSANITQVPIADGGEGTVEALVMATKGRMVYQAVMGPLGERISAYWGILGDEQTAVVEIAAAAGFALVAPDRRDPRITTTYGAGQLIKAALDAGMKKIIIGIGGSATNDGGVGMIQALGGKFCASDGGELPFGGAALARLASIDISGLDSRLAGVQIVVACDVDNPLCGPRGASAVYGPQKGANGAVVAELEAAMENYASIARQTTGRDIACLPGAGAAGGAGAGLLFFTKAELRPGIEMLLEATGFSEMVRDADLVITGEGRTDSQTANGKVPVGVAQAAQAHNVPTICLSGSLGSGYSEVFCLGIGGVMGILAQPMSLEECMGSATELIEEAAERMMRIVAVGMAIGAANCSA